MKRKRRKEGEKRGWEGTEGIEVRGRGMNRVGERTEGAALFIPGVTLQLAPGTHQRPQSRPVCRSHTHSLLTLSPQVLLLVSRPRL